MKKSPEPDLLAERRSLDFSKGERGKYYNRLQGSNIAIIAPDLLDTSPIPKP